MFVAFFFFSFEFSVLNLEDCERLVFFVPVGMINVKLPPWECGASNAYITTVYNSSGLHVCITYKFCRQFTTSDKPHY